MIAKKIAQCPIRKLNPIADQFFRRTRNIIRITIKIVGVYLPWNSLSSGFLTALSAAGSASGSGTGIGITSGSGSAAASASARIAFSNLETCWRNAFISARLSPTSRASLIVSDSVVGSGSDSGEGIGGVFTTITGVTTGAGSVVSVVVVSVVVVSLTLALHFWRRCRFHIEHR
jgi:hypothetical protein